MNTTENKAEAPIATKTAVSIPSTLDRRRFVKGLGLAGASLLSGVLAAKAAAAGGSTDNKISHGDAAILRFLAVAEILETDLWQQYAELAVNNKPYRQALARVNGDMVEYVLGNTADEVSHAEFLNAFLEAHGAEPVDFDEFRTLPSSQATGALQKGRLTSLASLNVDTSWYSRYRGTGNPDLGDVFPQVVNIAGRPAIPLRDGDSAAQIQAIANTAAFHFGTIEQGGSGLYANLAEKVSDLRVLRVVLSIGGTEVFHFAIWADTAGDSPAVNSGDGLVFPNLGAHAATDPDKIFPTPCAFLSTDLPVCSIIRPTSTEIAGAMGAMQALTDSGLFTGQSARFFHKLKKLARQADAASRSV